VINSPEMTVKEFFQVVTTFVNSTKDYHVGCRFQVTESSSLPFSVKSANGRYFVRVINEKKLDLKIFPINIGDELLSINGIPVDEIAAETVLKTGMGFLDADYAVADILLTNRSASLGEVPKGPVLVKFIDKETGNFKTYQMIWDHKPEYLTFHRDQGSQLNPSIFSKKMVASPFFRGLRNAKNEALVGSKNSFLPELGEIVWENDPEHIFQAYIFKTADGMLVGFLRIPHYYPGLDEKKEFMAELTEIMERFEESTCQMVIDQTNNPGGRVDFLYDMGSFFAEEPMKVPEYRLKMTPPMVAYFRMELQILSFIKSIEEAKKYLKNEEIYGIKRSLHFINMLKHSFQFLIAEWDAGKDMSGPTHILGVDYINPHPDVVYTKPVLLLINELSMSCADFFPAIMQDNNRAKIMGNRSTGAGGTVTEYFFLSVNGLSSLGYTGSLLERPKTKTPIENLGVVPDIEYRISEDDLQNEYEGYKQAILEVLSKDGITQ